MQTALLSELQDKFPGPATRFPRELALLDLPIIGTGKEKSVERRLFDLAWAIPPKVNWKPDALLNDLSPVAGLGAAAYCLRTQLKGQVRIVGHRPGGARELWLTRNSKTYKQLRRVRWYANGRMVGTPRSHSWFNVSGFWWEGAPSYYVCMALDGDNPYWWVITTSELMDQHERLKAGRRNQTYAEDEIFRIPENQWDNPGGFLRLRLQVLSGKYAFDSPEKVLL